MAEWGKQRAREGAALHVRDAQRAGQEEEELHSPATEEEELLSYWDSLERWWPWRCNRRNAVEPAPDPAPAQVPVHIPVPVLVPVPVPVLAPLPPPESVATSCCECSACCQRQRQCLCRACPAQCRCSCQYVYIKNTTTAACWHKRPGCSGAYERVPYHVAQSRRPCNKCASGSL